jgi:hypothetical protein
VASEFTRFLVEASLVEDLLSLVVVHGALIGAVAATLPSDRGRWPDVGLRPQGARPVALAVGILVLPGLGALIIRHVGVYTNHLHQHREGVWGMCR